MIESDQLFENFLVVQAGIPAIGREHGGVEPFMQVLEDGYQAAPVNGLVAIRQRFAGFQFFQHVVHAS